MSNKIQFKRGIKAKLPVLSVGEPAFTTDTKEFFIGDGSSNIEFAKQSDLEITNMQLSDMDYQTTTGTATAITLTMQTLRNGYAKTFIASASNGGVATTINGKPLYKPGTTTAPNLISGRAYTVWYNSASGCFFIKASAEGDAVASNVLAGKKFSNDNDTGMVGTLDLTNLVTGNIKSGVTINGVAGKASVVDTADALATSAQILYGSSAYVGGIKVAGTMPYITGDVNAQYPATQLTAGAYSGDGVNYAYMGVPSGYYLNNICWIKSPQPDLLAANILSGKNIFGVAGNATIESLGGRQASTGTGVLTTGNYNTQYITLSFIPTMVAVYSISYGSANYMGIWVPGSSSVSIKEGSATRAMFTVSSSVIGVTLGTNQFGFTYYWTAI